MASETWHDLGPVPGACSVCASDGALTMSEVRPRLSVAERLRREHVAPPARFVACGGCGWRWTVRSGDTPPAAVAAVAARTAVEPRGRHAAAALTVLPRPRERRALSARLR